MKYFLTRHTLVHSFSPLLTVGFYFLTACTGERPITAAYKVNIDPVSPVITAVGVHYKASKDDPSTWHKQVAVAQFTLEGKPNLGFGTRGKVTYELTASKDTGARATCSVIDPQERILIAGSLDTAKGDNTRAVFIMRLDKFGNRDKTWDLSTAPEAREFNPVPEDGVRIFDFSSLNDEAYDIAVQTINNDIKVWVVGNVNRAQNALVMRLNSNGTLDTTFNPAPNTAIGESSGFKYFAFPKWQDGTLGTPVPGSLNDLQSAQSISIYPDGSRILIGATAASGTGGGTVGATAASGTGGGTVGGGIGLARFNLDGSFDSAFGTSGKVIWRFTQEVRLDVLFRAVLQPDSGDWSSPRIVVAGNLNYDYMNTKVDGRIGAVRFNHDGTLDPTFNLNRGKLDVSLSPTLDTVQELLVDSKGRIIIAGNIDDGLPKAAGYVMRLTPLGELDSSFGSNGYVKVSYGDPRKASSLTNYTFGAALKQNDAIVVGGAAQVPISARYDIKLIELLP